MEETIPPDVEDEIAIERCRELLGHEAEDLSDGRSPTSDVTQRRWLAS